VQVFPGVYDMNIRIIAVGKIKETWLKNGIAEYIKRISKFCKIEIIQLPDASETSDLEKDINQEGSKILSRIDDRDLVIALDLEGNHYDSVEFSGKLVKWMEEGGSQIVFIIAGSNGFSKDSILRANHKISLSKLTFPHQIARLILLEQIFRSFKIANNEKYHK